MARVKLLQPEDCPDQTALIERIRKGRRGNVINVYKTLLHSPDIASVWLDLVNAVNSKASKEEVKAAVFRMHDNVAAYVGASVQ